MCLTSHTVYALCRDENTLWEGDENHFMGDLAGKSQKRLLWYDFRTSLTVFSVFYSPKSSPHFLYLQSKLTKLILED